MATEDNDTEAGGQTDDSGDSGGEEAEPAEGDRQAAKGDGEDKPKGGRDKRRANRFQEEREARLRAEQQFGELQGRYSGLERQFTEFRQQIERDKQQAQQSNASTETRTRISSLRQQARNYLMQAAQAKDNNELAQRLIDKHDELMDEADDLRAEMREEGRWEKRKGEFQQQGPSAEMMGEQMYFLSKYPWLDGNVEAQKMIRARFDSLVESGKRQPSRATMEEATTAIAKMLGLGGRQPGPSDRSRQVYAGTGHGDGEQDDSPSSGSMSADEVENTRGLRKLALLAYPDLEPRQAYAKFAKNEGSRAKNGVSAR